jgi:hypothetical protein
MACNILACLAFSSATFLSFFCLATTRRADRFFDSAA